MAVLTYSICVEQKMAPELLAYLTSRQPEFKAGIDNVINAALQDDDAFSTNFMTFIKAVSVTPFYTNEWPQVGLTWWL